MANSPIKLIWGKEGHDFVHIDDISGPIYSILECGGEPYGTAWPTPSGTLISSEGRKNYKRGDFLIGLWGGALVFRKSVLSAMGPMLRANGEVLPLDLGKDGTVYILNTKHCDCLLNGGYQDREHIRDIQREWRTFDMSKCAGRDIFVVPEETTYTYVSDAFIEAVKENRLTGVRFSVTHEL